MMRMLFAKVLPLGLTGAFLQSSISPIKPALNAFMAASGALAGHGTQNSGGDFEGMLQEQLANAKGGIAKPAAAPPKEDAKDQLNEIIAQVKGVPSEPGGAPAAARTTHSSHTKAKQATSVSATPLAPTPIPKGPELKLTSVGR